MDLTSLSSNLPRNPSSDEHNENADSEPSPAELMAAFRQAALSVTTLYRTATNELDRARRAGRAEGYAECLEDVLSLLVKIESRADAKTIEIVRQWSLSKRRKAGEKPRRRREDRETSMESERRSSSPVHAQAPHAQSTTSPSRRSPTRPTPAQVPALAFRDQPRPPPSDIVDLELPDHDIDSPPTSPRKAPQYAPPGMFQFQANTHASGSTKGLGKRSRDHHRTGSKRTFDSLNINDVFDLAGIEKLHNAKRSRY